MIENPPVGLMLVPMPLLAGLVGAVIFGLLTGSWLVALALFVVGAGLAFAAGWILADDLVLWLLGARPLLEGGSQQIANQLEELCARTGIPEPNLYTVGPGGPAIASFGRTAPSLVVTDGLSSDLTVVELEAAVARELARADHGMTTLDTLAVPFLTLPFAGLGRGWLDRFRGGDHDARIDLEGVAITRYPPGMSAALTKMALPAGQRGCVKHLWATPTAGGGVGRFGLAERLQLLDEL